MNDLAEWQNGLSGLSPLVDPCPGFRAGQWPSVYAAAVAFLDRYGAAAADAGWGTLELFGVHPKVGVARMDSSGALMVSSGSEVVEVGPTMLRYADGLVYRRAPLGGLSIPVWAFGTAAKP